MSTRFWESYGYRDIGTQSGKPFKTLATATKKRKTIQNGEVIGLPTGFVVRVGEAMTKEQALEFIEKFKSDPRTGYPKGIAPKNHKPLSVTHPWLFDKYRQALTAAGKQIWQRPYNQVSSDIPLTKYNQFRVQNGLEAHCV